MTTYRDTNFYSKPTEGEISVELETRLLISWRTNWLIWGVLSVDPSNRKQTPKQSFWVFVNLSTPEASDQILRLTEEIQ